MFSWCRRWSASRMGWGQGPQMGCQENHHRRFHCSRSQLTICEGNYPQMGTHHDMQLIITMIIITSAKQSSRHSGVLIMAPFRVWPMSQSQKQSSLPPVVNPHMGSFSSLYLSGNNVRPVTIWIIKSVKEFHIISDYLWLFLQIHQ